MNGKKLNWFEEIVSSLIAALIGAVVCVIMVVLWAPVRYLATKVWFLLFPNPAETTPAVPVTAPNVLPIRAPAGALNGLPTPDIFKGAANLAPAKQFTL